MSGWNYRVMRLTEADGSAWYGIYEVYYREAGVVDGWASTPASPGDETRDGILSVLAMMADAIGHPVLDFNTGAEVEDRKILSDEIMKVLQAAKDAGRIDFADPALPDGGGKP